MEPVNILFLFLKCMNNSWQCSIYMQGFFTFYPFSIQLNSHDLENLSQFEFFPSNWFLKNNTTMYFCIRSLVCSVSQPITALMWIPCWCHNGRMSLGHCVAQMVSWLECLTDSCGSKETACLTRSSAVCILKRSSTIQLWVATIDLVSIQSEFLCIASALLFHEDLFLGRNWQTQGLNLLPKYSCESHHFRHGCPLTLTPSALTRPSCKRVYGSRISAWCRHFCVLFAANFAATWWQQHKKTCVWLDF